MKFGMDEQAHRIVSIACTAHMCVFFYTIHCGSYSCWQYSACAQQYVYFLLCMYSSRFLSIFHCWNKVFSHCVRVHSKQMIWNVKTVWILEMEANSECACVCVKQCHNCLNTNTSARMHAHTHAKENSSVCQRVPINRFSEQNQITHTHTYTFSWTEQCTVETSNIETSSCFFCTLISTLKFSTIFSE